jgi:hypothetical protein
MLIEGKMIRAHRLKSTHRERRRRVALACATAVVYLMFGVAVDANRADASAASWRITSESLPTNLPPAQREVQQVAVYAEGGTFTLSFEGESTAPIAYNASSKAVQEALDSLSSVSEGGEGKVLVSGGPGGPSSGTPYRVTFAGSLAFVNVPQMSVDTSGLTGGSQTAFVTTPVQGGEGEGVLHVVAVNTGDAATTGIITMTDNVPETVTAASVKGFSVVEEAEKRPSLNCVLKTLTCTYAGTVLPGQSLVMEIHVDIPPKAPAEVTTEATVSGGGAAEASFSLASPITTLTAPFGIAPGSYFSALSSTEAGLHPNITTSFAVTTELNPLHEPVAVGQLHNVNVALPPGLIADPNPADIPRCSQADFYAGHCPSDTLVGTSAVLVSLGVEGTVNTATVPVYNLVPAAGRVVDFGFNATQTVWVHIFAHLRSGGDYGATATVEDISEAANTLASTTTLWGVPAEMNGPGSGELLIPESKTRIKFGAPNGAIAAVPFTTAPTSCGVPLSTSIEADSWQQIGTMRSAESLLPALSGCEALSFAPEFTLQPSTGAAAADSPTGVTANLKVPQPSSEGPESQAEATVKDTEVTLPADLQVNPSAAGGLVGCGTAEIGFRELEAGTGRPLFEEESEGQRLGIERQKECPEASAIGRVKVSTPLLPAPLEGTVYQAAQGDNPFKSLLALYIVAQDKEAGVRVRLAGEVKVAANGQLTATFDQTPQLPFEDFKLEFFGGARAALATTGCGVYKTSSSMAPWSGTPAVNLSSEFPIGSGPGGSPCSSLGSFSPSATGGTTNNAAGQFSPFVFRLGRNDTEQTLSTVSVKMPPGLAGTITKVQECPEAQANAGDCPAASQIGHVQVAVGVGPEPLVLPEAGRPEDPVYFTGPYKGSPFGIALVAHAEAGPFNLGTVVVRGKIDVDPHTAQVSIESEPAPTRLQGIPIDLRSALVTIDRPAFIFNPTNCSPMSLTGSIGSSEGATSHFESRFEAADCASLPFKPGFAVGTKAAHTRRYGAYLHITLTSGSGQANIKSVYVELPKILPSRQETLKQACAAKQFEINPAACPQAARVGYAIVHTPVLPVPLSGPAILVSHGGAAFPDLDIVLQGDGVTSIQSGNTNITKGITSSDFKSVPDVPISNFELTLPTGRYSVLAATANLCTTTVTRNVRKQVNGRLVHYKRRVKVKRTLTMPTTITGQNGAVVKQATRIVVAGCAKGKGGATKRRQKKGTAHKSSR